MMNANMLLAVDIGNTQTVLGLFDGSELVHTWRLASEVGRTSDELRVTILQLFEEAVRNQQAEELAQAPVPIPRPGEVDPIPQIEVDRVVIASVVPALTFVWKELARSLTAVTTIQNTVSGDAYYGVQTVIEVAPEPPLIVSAQSAEELTAHLQNPAEVGADRIANAVAAKALYGAPAIVLDFGTATNIDVIDNAGRYLGGIISAGVQTSADALFQTAARLPVMDLKVPPQVLGTTTKTAVQSGILHGEVAKIGGLLYRLQLEQPNLADANVPIIATGGMAPLIAPMISQVTHHDEHLTLKGLQIIASTLSDQTTDTTNAGTNAATGGARPCVT